MKKKIIIIASILCLVLGIWVVKANIKNSSGKTITTVAKSHMLKSRHAKTAKFDWVEDADANSDYITPDKVLLYLNNGYLALPDITPATALQVFGAPTSQTTEYSDVDFTNVVVYTYDSGEISFLNGALSNIDINDEGMSIQILNGTPTNFDFSPGTEAQYLYNIFNSSYANETNNNVHVYFRSLTTGVPTDAGMVFTIAGGDASLSPLGSLSINSISIQW